MATILTSLTPAARREAWLRLDHILHMLPIAKAKGKTREKFLGMERDLARDLLRLWLDTCAKALKGIFQDIPDFTSKEAMELLQQSLADLLGPAFGSSPEAQGVMKWGVQRAYRAAKSQFIMPVPEKGKASPPLSLPDHRAISVLTRHNCFWLGERYGKAIRPKIAKLAQEALDEGLGRDQLAELLRRGLGEAAPGGYTYWDVVASSAIVRARSFGTVSGMEEAGITEYEILAMGDERMCPICGEMHGRTFSVAETRKVIDRVLDITDPEKFKAAMPWQTEAPKGKSNADLLSSGQSLPPFHGRCRCTLVVVGEREAEAPQPEPTPQQPDIPPIAKTIEEANEIAVKYGIAKKADFSGLDVSAANEVNQAVWRAKQLFPKFEALNSIESSSRLSIRTLASTSKASRGIKLNRNRMSPGAIDELRTITLPDMVARKFFPMGCDTVKSLMDHEIGHLIDYLLNARADPVITDIFVALKKRGKGTIENELSGYAETDIAEFIAEAWREVQNNITPRPVAKQVVARLIELRDGKG